MNIFIYNMYIMYTYTISRYYNKYYGHSRVRNKIVKTFSNICL